MSGTDNAAHQATPGTALAVRDGAGQSSPHRLRKAAEYLAAPNGGQWRAGTTEEQKASKAAVEALFDAWPAMRDGQVVPKWFDVPRFGRTVKNFHRKGRPAELLVKSAIAVPALLELYEKAWTDTFDERPQDADMHTVAHSVLDLLSQGLSWPLMQKAVVKAAEEGHVFIGRAYRETLAAQRAVPKTRPTQGQTLVSAYELALRRQAEIEGREVV